MEKLTDQHFIFSSELDNPNEFFQGYCFHEADYIYGKEGYNKYKRETSIQIEGGEDGCYVLSRKVNDEFHFFSDYYGYKKIFYYWEKGFWVVSNSIYLIAEHLKENGIGLEVEYSQLACIGRKRKGFFLDQLFSLKTIIKNVKLLPIGNKLIISSASFEVVELKDNIVFESYEQGLSYFLGMWVARIAGLLINDIHVKSDLTGGLDSRAVFAIVKKATEVAKTKNLPAFSTGSTPSNRIDLDIATEITEFYGLPLNKLKPPAINDFSGLDSYSSWKILCLGVYHPFAFANCGPQHDIVFLSGGGAENHRPLYSFNDKDSFIKTYSKDINPTWLSYNFIKDFKEEFKRISQNKSNMKPMVHHYREYRNRIHAGRNPQYRTTFNPLGSKILDSLSEIAGSERIANGQVNYDIMATLLPSILDIRFDNPSKALNEVKEKYLTKLGSWHEYEAGKTYADTDAEVLPIVKTDSRLHFLKEDFNIAKEKPFVKDFFGTDFIEQAELAMQNAIKNKGFPHSVEARGIAAILTGALFE